MRDGELNEIDEDEMMVDDSDMTHFIVLNKYLYFIPYQY